MKRLILLFCCAAGPALASTPYQAGLPDAVCNGKSVCRFAFPTVPAGESLTIQHVSCSIETAGQTSFINSFVLSVSPAKPGLTDYLASGLNVAGANSTANVDTATLFYVSANGQPIILASGAGKIIGNASGGCFISGIQTP